jgi:hypothetical protein
MDRLFMSPLASGAGAFNMACEVSTLDAFPSTLNGEFELDQPMLMALASNLALTDPNSASLLLAASMPPGALPQNAAAADSSFDRLMAATRDSLIGGGNIGGNVASGTEAVLRAAWKRQAMNGFKSLTSGAKTGTVRLGPHISIEPRNIGKGGELRKGARLMVKIRGLPMTVVHSLPAPILSKAGGQFGAMRVGATDLRRMTQSAAALADARVQSVRLLRTASSKFGGGVLAFGPSAAIDLYDSAQWSDGALAVNWKGFAVRSAKSQSGNLVGMGVGMGAAAGAVALGVVAAVGWPVVLVGLGAGLVAQVAWGYFGADEVMARQAEQALR